MYSVQASLLAQYTNQDPRRTSSEPQLPETSHTCHPSSCSPATSQSCTVLGISGWKSSTFSLTLFSFNMPVTVLMICSWAVFQKTCLTCVLNYICWLNSPGRYVGQLLPTFLYFSFPNLVRAASFRNCLFCIPSLSGLRSRSFPLCVWGGCEFSIVISRISIKLFEC